LSKRSKSALRGILVATFLIAASSLQASDDRAEIVGRGMICMCGTCHQLLSECNHLGCPSAEPMRKELKQYIEEGEDDKTILASFAAKYGPKVLSAPPTDNWFDLSAWIMPFAVFALGTAAVVFSLKKLRTAPVDEAPAPPANTSAYEKEIEEELRKFTPED
jgi:cytochrome c-type biogenesis protein CcmH/NrfF